MAFVCLTSRFSLRVARTVTPRRRPGQCPVYVFRDELRKILADCAPSTLVVEHGRKGAGSGALQCLRETALGIGRTEGMRVVEVRVADACTAIAGSARRDAPVRLLADCYPEIAVRLDRSRPGFFRSEDHRRELRPLIAAATLAHAVGLHAVQAIPAESLTLLR